MKILTQKRIGWTLFCLGSGGALIFLWLIAIFWNERGMPRTIAPWFLGAAVVVVGAIIFLRRCYRIEPLHGKRIFQLSITDLIVVSVFTALEMAVGQAWIGESRFLTAVLPMTVLTVLGLLIGLILASRRSLGGWRRYLYGYGFVLFALGALASGAFVCGLIPVASSEGMRGVWDVIRGLLGLTTVDVEARLLFNAFRVFMVGLPIGWLLCRTGQREHKI